MTGAAALELRNVSKRFPLPKPHPFATRQYVHAVTDVSFDVQRGEAVGLVGESGSGKTTVALSLLGLVTPSAGSIRFCGTDTAELMRTRAREFRRALQFVFQDPYASLNPRMTIRSAILEPIMAHGLAKSSSAADQRVGDLLEMVGLPRQAASRYPHEFSGGQRQRIGIARALAVEPEVIVADEPVSALDVSVQAQIIELLKELRRSLSLSLLLVSHDLGVVGYMCDRIIVMYLGRVMEVGPTETIFERPAHPYTEALLSAIPSTKFREARPRIVLSGDVPSPVSPPSGCVFRTRCPYALPACAEAVPALRADGNGHAKACIRDDVVKRPAA